jgi:hypothetical protein
MQERLLLILQEIDKCYLLGGQELLEKERLVSIQTRVRTELADIVKELDHEILQLQVKKQSSGLRNELKPGFHNITTAHSTLEVWRILTNEILNEVKNSRKIFKNRLEAEGLFIESRSKEGDDIHLLIGQRDGTPKKAHIIVDEKTGEIRIEDNQIEPLELVRKIESIITLPTGKKIKITRESIEEIID